MKRLVQKATRKQTKAYNTRLVLRTIYDSDRISRADVARATGLTRPTVSDAVANLRKRALVEEVGQGPSAGGKPPILLSVVDDSRHAIAIDLASGEFRGAVVNLRGEIRHRVSLPLDGRDGDDALALVYELVDRLVAASSSSLLGIGLGTPGLMDPMNGVVRRAVNLDWQDLPLRSLLKKRYGLPLYVANDCQVAALAEFTFGEAKGTENLVVVKVEHGIGAGIVLNGQLFHGDTFGAGEIGHVVVAENGRPCRCGHVGCLETVASNRAIIERAQATACEDPHSLLHQFARRPEEIGIPEICRAVEAGDEAMRQAILEVGRYLGLAVANLIGVLSVRCILIAGSVTCFGQLLLDAIQQEMVQRSLSAVARETRLGVSSIGSDIVILGAAALVLTQELGLFAPLMGGF
jgi:glucokinase-like ROK family protein